ncbi:MAG: EAL domain-containing protein [Actinobacteria bacterium]|nr:EAL domain-containing protein [Actinomycetota bacterium]
MTPDEELARKVAEITDTLMHEGPMKSLMAHLPAVVYIEELSGLSNEIYVSPQIEDVLGFTPEEWLSSPGFWAERIHPDDRDRVVQEAERSSELGDRFHMEYRLIHKNGHVVWITEDDVCVRGDEGEPLYWQGVMLDVTSLKAAEDKLRLTESQFQAVVEQLPAIIYVDPPGQDSPTVYVSPQIEKILGVTPEEYLADPLYWRNHLHPEDRERAEADYDSFAQTGSPDTSDYRMLKPDGSVVWISDKAMAILDEDGSPLMVQGVMFDVTKQRMAEEQVAHLSHHDRLTGLSNRAMFEEMLEISLARARRSDMAVAVLMLDLDDFKLVNNSLGHEAGDELLRQLAIRLRDTTSDTDLVARQGGDEFLIALTDIFGATHLPGPDMDAALIAGESMIVAIQGSLEKPFSVSGTEAYVTASIGMSLFPGHASDAHTLLQNADSAMYRSKSLGPGGYAIHSPEANESATRLDFSTRLRKAVESKNWVLHYQPVVDLTDAHLVGVEALLRWEDPNGGLIPPGEFIPLAEEMGLIETIGDWVIEDVCRQAAEWHQDGIDLEVGFNLSPRQLWQPDLPSKILSSVEAAGVDPAKLILEITEGTAMTDPERTQHILWDLHGRGLRLAIDDFGTGYSSLSRLKHLPVSTLKIDRAFVMDLPTDPDAGSMADAIIQLARSLGMSPLAEGIETELQWRFLAERGCELGQGYYFSRPVPAAEITALAKGGSLRMADDVTPF